jgi:hypothetical protein
MSHYRTTMWEAVAAEDQFRQLLEWATDVAVPDLVASDPAVPCRSTIPPTTG